MTNHTVENTFTISKILTKSENSIRAKNALNKILNQNPTFQHTVLAIVLYPALKWSLYGENIGDLIQNANLESDEFLYETQMMLRSVFGVGKKIELTKRTEYFEAARNVVDALNESVTKMKSAMVHGNQMAATLQLVMNVPFENVSDTPSRFEISKYLPKAVENIHLMCGKILKQNMEPILNPSNPNFDTEDDEYMYAYHNVRLLLREYSRLCFSCDNDDITAQILHAKTPEDVLAVTKKKQAMYSADAVAQFLLLVSGAIALVEYYPNEGTKYSKVLTTLVSNRHIKRTDGTEAILQEKELAILLGYSSALFSNIKNEAFTLLSLLLWGYDGKAITKLLGTSDTMEIQTDE